MTADFTFAHSEEGFDENLAEELKNRAISYIEEKEEEYDKERKKSQKVHKYSMHRPGTHQSGLTTFGQINELHDIV